MWKNKERVWLSNVCLTFLLWITVSSHNTHVMCHITRLKFLFLLIFYTITGAIDVHRLRVMDAAFVSVKPRPTAGSLESHVLSHVGDPSGGGSITEQSRSGTGEGKLERILFSMDSK